MPVVAEVAQPGIRGAVLSRAASLITGDRQADYGDAAESFDRIATMWSAYLGATVKAHDVAAMMALLKISRSLESPTKGDSWTDLAGYAALGAELAGVTEP